MTQPPAGNGGVATVSCGVCATQVPAAAYCGVCGGQLAEPGGGRGRLRMAAYSVAPGEQVVRLSVASSLFSPRRPDAMISFIFRTAPARHFEWASRFSFCC